MNKNELYELRKKVLDSKKCKKINIEGSEGESININVLYDEHYFLYENVYSDYKTINNVDALEHMKKSCEGLVKILGDNNVSYDSISILLCPTFFMNEYDVDNNVDENSNIAKDEFREDMLIDKNLVEISYLLSVKKDDKYVDLGEEVRDYINKVANKQFLVDYNFFSEWVIRSGFPLKDSTYSELIQSQINNRGTNISLDFEKEKTF